MVGLEQSFKKPGMNLDGKIRESAHLCYTSVFRVEVSYGAGKTVFINKILLLCSNLATAGLEFVFRGYDLGPCKAICMQ